MLALKSCVVFMPTSRRAAFIICVIPPARVMIRASLRGLLVFLDALWLAYVFLPADFQQMFALEMLFARPDWWGWLLVYYTGINVAVLVLTGMRCYGFLRRES